MVKVIWGPSCISDLRQAYISKTTGRRAKHMRLKFGPWGFVFSVYRILVKLSASGNSGGSSRVFLMFNNLVSRKRQVLEWNVHLNLYVIQFYVVIVCHLVKQSAKPLGFLFTRKTAITQMKMTASAKKFKLVNSEDYIYKKVFLKYQVNPRFPSFGLASRSAIFTGDRRKKIVSNPIRGSHQGCPNYKYNLGRPESLSGLLLTGLTNYQHTDYQ